MLFQLGNVFFKMTPFEVHDVTHESTTDYAPKDLLQAPRPREWTGEGDEHYRFICTLFPTRIGGLRELELLQQQRRDHLPWPLIRGDGVPLGSFFIERVTEHDTFLTLEGIGRVREIEISLVRSPMESAAARQAMQQVAENLNRTSPITASPLTHLFN